MLSIQLKEASARERAALKLAASCGMEVSDNSFSPPCQPSAPAPTSLDSGPEKSPSPQLKNQSSSAPTSTGRSGSSIKRKSRVLKPNVADFDNNLYIWKLVIRRLTFYSKPNNAFPLQRPKSQEE
ncbi:unnamed protein product, partial [Sphagnum compactum]